MTIRYQVIWTPEAEDDVAGIVDWFQDLTSADKLISEFEDRANGLASFPERGRTVPELLSIGVVAYREIIHKSWRMVHTIRHRDVWIMAVLDGRRHLDEVLFARFARPHGRPPNPHPN